MALPNSPYQHSHQTLLDISQLYPSLSVPWPMCRVGLHLFPGTLQHLMVPLLVIPASFLHQLPQVFTSLPLPDCSHQVLQCPPPCCVHQLPVLVFPSPLAAFDTVDLFLPLDTFFTSSIGHSLCPISLLTLRLLPLRLPCWFTLISIISRYWCSLKLFLYFYFPPIFTPWVISSCPVDYNTISMLMIPHPYPDLSL